LAFNPDWNVHGGILLTAQSPNLTLTDRTTFCSSPEFFSDEHHFTFLGTQQVGSGEMYQGHVIRQTYLAFFDQVAPEDESRSLTEKADSMIKVKGKNAMFRTDICMYTLAPRRPSLKIENTSHGVLWV
jgi:hypothetical protein